MRASALLGCTNRILIPRLAKMAPNSKFFDQLAPKIPQPKAPVRFASDASYGPSVRMPFQGVRRGKPQIAQIATDEKSLGAGLGRAWSDVATFNIYDV